MTEAQFLVKLPGAKVPAAAVTPHHIHRDVAFVSEAFTRPEIFAEDDSGQITPLLHIALAALTLPAIAYSFGQMWSLMHGDTLLHAIRTLVP